jgi:two-component system chemotaxis response regulator CheY
VDRSWTISVLIVKRAFGAAGRPRRALVSAAISPMLFPAGADPLSSARKVSGHGAEPTMKPKKVLIADDSPLMHKLLQALLPGVAVVHAMDGREALSRLAEHPDVDLMIVDLTMPGMNGLELVDQLKLDGALARIPVVIMTTEGREQDALACLRAGAAGYVRKPFQHHEMLDLIALL